MLARPSEPSVSSRKFWDRYVPFWNPESPAPFKEISHQLYDLPKEGTTVRSMLSSLELAVLFALGKDYWSARGEIVDLGCLYGLTTHCLAAGMRANLQVGDANKQSRIYAYDLFLAEDYDFYAPLTQTVHSGSLFPDFQKLNRRYQDMIVPCPGDLLKMRWGKNPVEILFIDAAKSWELNQAIVDRFFPALITGAIVLQQDYLNWFEYWTVITMEHFSDHFELLYMMYGATAVYRCTNTIAKSNIPQIASLPHETKERLLVQAIEKAPTELREPMLCAYASCLIDHKKYQDAEKVLSSITAQKVTDDPALDLHAVVATNKVIVENKLRQSL